MNKIHPNSQITTIPDFDLFSVPPTQATIEKNYVTEHRPIATLNANSMIQFQISSSLDEYIHLSDSLFYIKLRINILKAAGGNVDAADWAKIQPVNNLMHSLFKSVELEIEGKSITMAPQTYAYKAFFETFLGYTEEAKMGYLKSVLWYNDEAKKTAVDAKQSKIITPDPINSNGNGKYIDLCGKLHLDLGFQPRPLIGGLKINLTLIPNESKFYLWHDATITSTVEFNKAALYIKRSKVARPVVEAHNLALTKGTAKYPIMRSSVKSTTITSGNINVNIDNAVSGQIPRRMFLAMVDSQGYNGNTAYNPYKFEHFNLNELTATVDGVQYPSIAYRPNFTDGLYVKEYLSLYETLNQLTSAPTLTLTRGEFTEGSAIYGFSFAPDPVDDCNKVGYVNFIQHGAVNLNLQFSSALTNNINVLLYCEFDNMMQLDSTRQPICDYI